MVGPLVEDAQGALEAGVDDGVLGEDGHSQAHDDLGNAVVDLGVEVVGAACEHDATHAVLTHPLDGFDALRTDFGLDGGVFLPGLVQGGLHLLDRDVVAVFLEGLGQVGGQVVAVAEVDEGADELGAGLRQALHVVADDLGVGRHDGAVEGVFGLGELLLEVDAWVEDRRDALVQQGLDVSVDELGRVAHVLRGDGLHARLEQVVVGAARNHDAEAQSGEHREPERVVLVHAEHARDADVAAERLFFGEAAVAEDPLVLPVVEVGQLRLLGHALQGRAALAAVAGHVTLAVGERRDRHLAVVLAQAAGLAGRVHAEALEGLDRGEGRGPLPRVVHARGQGGAVGAHQASDVGAHDLAAGEQLEGAQDRVVEEGAALDDDALTQVRGFLELDDLVEGVTHDGVGQAGADVAHVRAFLLRLLDRRVHEHGAAGAQIHGGRGLHGHAREGAHVGAHRLREGLQEGAAARGAGLVDGDGVHRVVADAQVLHVLAADVDDGGDAGADELGGAVVRHRLDLALVHGEGSLDQALAVAGRTRAADLAALGQRASHRAHDVDGRGHGVALVGGVVGEDDAVLGVDDDRLDRRRARVDAEPAAALGLVEAGLGDHVEAVAGDELLAILWRGEKRVHARRLDLDGGGGEALHEGGELLAAGLDGGRARFLGLARLLGGLLLREEGRADRDVELGVVGGDEGVSLGQEGLVGLAQGGQEVQGASEEHDGSANRAPARQAGDGLGGNGVEDGGGQVLVGGTLVDERLNIRLGEHAAARGDRVELGVAGCQLAEAGGVRVQEGRHLVDERAGAARAGAVHALLGGGVQVGELGVLAAQLDDDVDLGVEALGGLGAGDDLLDEGDAHGAGGRQAAGTGDGRVDAGAGQGALNVGEEGSQGCAHVGVVTTVVGEKATVSIQNDSLDRRRADVDAELVGARCLVMALRCHGTS